MEILLKVFHRFVMEICLFYLLYGNMVVTVESSPLNCRVQNKSGSPLDHPSMPLSSSVHFLEVNKRVGVYTSSTYICG